MVHEPSICLTGRGVAGGANVNLTTIGGRITQNIGVAVDDVHRDGAWRWVGGLLGGEHPAEPRREAQGGAEEELLGVGARSIRNARSCVKGHDLLETYFSVRLQFS